MSQQEPSSSQQRQQHHNEATTTTTTEHKEDSEKFLLKIRFSHSGETHSVLLTRGAATTIQQLIRLITDQCIMKHESLRNEYSRKPIMRLIHNGRLLTGTNSKPTSHVNSEFLPISVFHIENHSFIHCAFSEKQSNSSSVNSQSNIHNTTPVGAFYQGFDVLLNAGLAREEVNEVRRQFYASRSNLIDMHRRGQLTQNDMYQIEQEWMNESSTTTSSSFPTSPPTTGSTAISLTPQQQEQQQQLQEQQRNDRVGNVYTFFLGVLLGFFFGIITVVALLERKALSKRLVLGIQIGVVANIVVSVFRYYYPSLLPYLL
ncbi:hypothetical protein C9374_012615 [Naegleria lovaniensis]|uniref:DSC E3 ubiquitin ligase complex subunit 3 C-terminal domain-containing protein n=1 Tax=Naegleria lovaniensis TaxID=51637 RepID=A0AA88KNP8_NAELO|nr:uncharacterized protein C9374_012615 [Naegleria lovaniensis]KAG2392363.1 hypothetical protein C9374_012615 [Naegleria lovaniensis]